MLIKLMTGIELAKRSYKHNPHKYLLDYSTDADSYQKHFMTSTAEYTPPTRPGHARAKRESGRDYGNPYDSENEKQEIADKVMEGFKYE